MQNNKIGYTDINGLKTFVFGAYAGYPANYISLTELAKYKKLPTDKVLFNWIKNKSTAYALAAWEVKYNLAFNYEAAIQNAGHFTSLTHWATTTNAIGIFTINGGVNRGTYAHKDIAIYFTTWLSPEFAMAVAGMTEFNIIHTSADPREVERMLHRFLARTNYHIHNSAVGTTFPNIPDIYKDNIFAQEANMLNLIVFGKSALDWRTANPNCPGNMRDYASKEDLHVLQNLEVANDLLIHLGYDNILEREGILRECAVRYRDIFRKTHKYELKDMVTVLV